MRVHLQSVQIICIVCVWCNYRAVCDKQWVVCAMWLHSSFWSIFELGQWLDLYVVPMSARILWSKCGHEQCTNELASTGWDVNCMHKWLQYKLKCILSTDFNRTRLCMNSVYKWQSAELHWRAQPCAVYIQMPTKENASRTLRWFKIEISSTRHLNLHLCDNRCMQVGSLAVRLCTESSLFLPRGFGSRRKMKMQPTNCWATNYMHSS